MLWTRSDSVLLLCAVYQFMYKHRKSGLVVSKRPPKSLHCVQFIQGSGNEPNNGDFEENDANSDVDVWAAPD